MKILLLVTWLSSPPSSYQVEFSTTQACEAAKAAVLADAQRLAVRPSMSQAGGMRVFTPGSPAPQVSAVCVQQ